MGSARGLLPNSMDKVRFLARQRHGPDKPSFLADEPRRAAFARGAEIMGEAMGALAR